MSYQIIPIGIVKNSYDEPVSPLEIKSKPSLIMIKEEYSDALMNIESCSYIDVYFVFHKSEEIKLKTTVSNPIIPLCGKTFSGEIRGVFASRSPIRPNSIGHTTVKLLGRKNNSIKVEGLDALNESPVIDIKCCDTSLFAKDLEINMIHNSILSSEPRIEIMNNILENKFDILLLKSAQLHGHYCPSLALGVLASAHAIKEYLSLGYDLENKLTIIETNCCFADGVQFVTGCSFGNKSLIFCDQDLLNFTVYDKYSKQGVKVETKKNAFDIIKDKFPKYKRYYKNVIIEKNTNPIIISKYKQSTARAAFESLNLPIEELFTMNTISLQ